MAHRFLIFAGSNFYPAGGADDYIGGTDELASAIEQGKAAAESESCGYGWFNILDTADYKMAACGDFSCETGVCQVELHPQKD